MLNAVAIGVAVLLIPALTRSSVTAAVPRTDPVVAPSPTITQQQGFNSDVPPPALDRTATRDELDRTATRDELDRTATRDGLDHDDTVAPPPPATLVPTNGSGFVSPVPGAITGAFGQRFHPILHYWRMHNGVDMRAACGTVVVATYRGRVIEAGGNGGYGNLVVVDHGRYQGKQVLSKYAHLSRIGVRVGDRVGTGQGIALSGTTGLSTGCHLHFEIKENGAYVDPAPYLTGKKSPRPDDPIKDLGPTTKPSPSPSASASAKPSADPRASADPKPTASPRPTASPKPSAAPSRSPKPSPRPPRTSRPSPAPSTTPPSAEPSRPPDPEPSETPTPKPTRSSSPTPPATPRESSAPKQPTPTTSSQAPGPSSTAAEEASPTPSGSVTEGNSASIQRWATRRD